MVIFFKEDTNAITKGELTYKADFVLYLHFTGLTVVSYVRASMTDESYSVTLTVDGDFVLGNCACLCGKWMSSHMAATVICVDKKGMSEIDLPNTRLAKPKKAAKLGTKAHHNLFPHPKPVYKAC